MDTKDIVKSQYHASFEMLRQAIIKCPDSLWDGREYRNAFWRVAYHALFFTHLCHCPIARQRLEEISPTLCYCSTGWYRRLWEGVLGKPVRVKLLRCMTRGADSCQFAIHI